MENPIAERFGENLREVRTAVAGMRQAELADCATDLGVPIRLNTISRLEKGARMPSIEELLVLAIALGVTPNRLLLTRTADPDQEVPLTPNGAVRVPETAAWFWADGTEPLPDGDLPEKAHRVDPWDFGEQNRPHSPPDRTRSGEVQRHLGALNKISKKIENVRLGADGELPEQPPVPRRVLAAYLNQQALVLQLDDRAEVSGLDLPGGEG